MRPDPSDLVTVTRRGRRIPVVAELGGELQAMELQRQRAPRVRGSSQLGAEQPLFQAWFRMPEIPARARRQQYQTNMGLPVRARNESMDAFTARIGAHLEYMRHFRRDVGLEDC